MGSSHYNVAFVGHPVSEDNIFRRFFFLVISHAVRRHTRANEIKIMYLKKKKRKDRIRPCLRRYVINFKLWLLGGWKTIPFPAFFYSFFSRSVLGV